MTNNLAKFLIGALALGAAMLPAQARPLDDVRESGMVSVAVYRDFPPYSYEGEAGEGEAGLMGIDVDVGREIAKRMGLNVTFLQLTADENADDDLRNAVWKGPRIGGGVADIMLHVPVDREFAIRNDLVKITAPYFRERLAVARTRPTSVVTALSEDRIGVEIDSISDMFLSGAHGGGLRENAKRYINLTLAIPDLISGDLTALMGPRGEIEGILHKELGPEKASRWVISPVATPGLTRPEWLLGLAVKHDSRDLGYFLEDVVRDMLADGTVEAIFKKHGLTHAAP